MNPFAAQFPVNLNIEGKPVLLVGGGRIAYRKAEQLLVCNPLLTVISPEIDERFHATGATEAIAIDSRLADMPTYRGLQMSGGVGMILEGTGISVGKGAGQLLIGGVKVLELRDDA